MNRASHPKQAKLYCFVDTNTLIHFQTFDEVDWPKQLGVSEVYLVLAPTVMNELNKFKDDSSHVRRQKRVRTLWTKLKPLLNSVDPGQPTVVRSGVFVIYLVKEPRIDWGREELDPGVQDDRLLATMLEFRQKPPDCAILLVSNDYPLQLKARSRQVVTRDATEVLDAYEMPSPEEVEIKRLTKELQTLRNRLPQVKLGFTTNGQRADRLVWTKQPVRKPWPSDDETAQLVAKERTVCLDKLDADLVAAQEGEKYEAQVETYIGELREYLRKLRARNLGWRIDLGFTLENSGTAPATDITAVVQFPDETYLIWTEEIDDAVIGLKHLQPPARPKPPGPQPIYSPVQNLLDLSMPRLPQPLVTYQPPPGLRVYVCEQDVRLTHPKLRPKDLWPSESVTVYLRPTEEKGITLTYHIHADELPSPLTGNLHIVLNEP